MNPNLEILLTVARTATPGAAPISLTDALLLLFLGGLLVAAWQLHRVVQRLDALERRLTSARTRPEPMTPPPAPGQPAGETVSPELVAALMAACHVALGRPARIVSITDEAELKRVWSLEGRRQIFASHQVR